LSVARQWRRSLETAHPKISTANKDVEFHEFIQVLRTTFVLSGAKDEDWALVIFDLPLSAAADTLVLPYTVVRQSKYGDLCTGLETNETAH